MRYGWESIEGEFPGIAPTFFSSQRVHFADLEVHGDTLVPGSEPLREMFLRSCKFEPAVIAADYDRYILCGMNYSVHLALRELQKLPLSDAGYPGAMTDFLRETVSMQVARKVRAITARPMTIVPAPRLNDANGFKLYARLRETGKAEKIAAHFASASATLAKEIDAEIVPQPPQTLADPLQTLAIYADGAPREFDIAQRPEDWKDLQHMNAEYGALMLRSLLGRARSPRRAASTGTAPADGPKAKTPPAASVKKICIIGDSHTSAIKRAWTDIAAEYPGIAITFFSSHRRRFSNLAVVDGALAPLDEELKEVFLRSCKFDPVIAADYDRYIVCGLDFSLFSVMTRLKDFRSDDQAPDNRVILSPDCYLRAMTGCLRESVSVEVARKVRAITDRPMTILPAPRISDANGRTLYRRLRETGDGERIAGYFSSASEALGKEFDADIAQQPPRTLSDPLQTLAAYEQVTPLRFGADPPPERKRNYQHMTVEYGALVLRALFAPARI